MITQLISYQTLYRFPTGRADLTLRRMLGAIEGTGLDAFRALLERAVLHLEATRRLEFAWLSHREQNEHAPEAVELHRELNLALATLDDFLASAGKALGTQRGEAARRAHRLLFPVAASVLSREPFAEEAAMVGTILELIEDDPPLARALRELGLQGLTSRLAELHRSFDEALHERRKRSLFAQVQAARDRVHELVVEAVYVAAGLLVLRGYEGAEAEALSEALSVAFEQNEAIKRYYRRRRRVSDVDPETGEELEPLEDDDDATDVEEVPVASPMKLHGDDDAAEAA